MKFGILLWGLFLGLLLGGPWYIMLVLATSIFCGIMGARDLNNENRKSETQKQMGNK